MSSSRLAQEKVHRPLSSIYPASPPPSSLSCTGSLVQIDCRLRGSVTIDMIPDVALLEIFDCYVNQAREEEVDNYRWLTIQAWHTLVHVCRKWRTIVLGSPRRLDLRLFCKDTTPVKETLAVWPPLPIILEHNTPEEPMDNIIAALEYNDRICDIRLSFATNSLLEEVLAAMQRPFSVLMNLDISLWDRDEFGPEVEDETPPIVPESFLGGSAPRLQDLYFRRVPFPGVPKLLLSATDLVNLCLLEIPHSGYISPEAMVRCLSTLTRLECLAIGFESPLSRPVRETRRPHLPTFSARGALPALTFLQFYGVSEYLEDLVARIDAPILNGLNITFFHQLIFDTPQLAQFLARSPYTQPPVESRIVFSPLDVEVTLPWRSFSLTIKCSQSDWQLSSLAQVCSSSFPEASIPTVEHLYIHSYELQWQDDIEDSQWLEVLHPFTAVKYLYLSRGLASHITSALQEHAGEVLPSLQNLFLEDRYSSSPVTGGAIGKFVAARQLAGHPIAVFPWDKTKQVAGS